MADDESTVGNAVESEENRASGGIAATSKGNALRIFHEELLQSVHRILITTARRDRFLRAPGIASRIRPRAEEHRNLVLCSLGLVTGGVEAPSNSPAMLARGHPRTG